MFINYANSIYDRPDGNMDKNKSILINSCGTYRLETYRSLPTLRPEGRNDYQLIYIASGRGFFYFGEAAPTVVRAGNMILYRPGECQKYIYYGEDRPDVYWIHFTGKDIEKIFDRYGLSASGHVIPAGIHPDYASAFSRIILELQMQREFCEDLAALIFVRIIMTAGRAKKEAELFREGGSAAEIDQARTYFCEHYRENINIADYIEKNGMSVSWFFKKFREETGVSPLQYILDIRLKNAAKLLETTDCSVSEIAAITGYDNALYFSRLFRRHAGMSPREYRKKRKNADGCPACRC